MRERPSGTFAANYALVVLVEIAVIAALWFAGRYFA
jgi:hypothetical protein